MRFLLLSLPVVPLATRTAPAPAPEPEPKPGAGNVLATDDQKTVYSLGVSPAGIELVKQEIAGAAAGKPALNLVTWGPKFEAFGKERGAGVAEQKAGAAACLAKDAAEPGATKTGSGTIGRAVTAGAAVNGTERFALNQVIPLWTTALVCPSSLVYGGQGRPPVPGGAAPAPAPGY